MKCKDYKLQLLEYLKAKIFIIYIFLLAISKTLYSSIIPKTKLEINIRKNNIMIL